MVFRFAVFFSLLVVGGAGGYAYWQGLPPFGPGGDTWMGVFLTNGQAYFGHFYSGPGDYARLREVYVVTATQGQTQDPRAVSPTQLTVQPLGGEVYGPKQEMSIAKSQILFVEELRPDSPVVDAIARSKGDRPAAPAAPPVIPQTVSPPTPSPAVPSAPPPSPVPTPPATASLSPGPSGSPARSPSPTPTR